jgi:hypothetical protein
MSAPWISLSCVRSYYRLNVCSVTILVLYSFILQTKCLLRDYPCPVFVHITDWMSAPWPSLSCVRSYYKLNACSMTILVLCSFIIQTECLLRDYSCPVFVHITDWMSAPWLLLPYIRSYYRLNVCSVTILVLCSFILQTMSAPWLSLSCVRSYYKLNACSMTILVLCSFIIQTKCLLRDYSCPVFVHITDWMSAPWLSLPCVRSYYRLNVCSVTILVLCSFILQTECLLRDYPCPVFVHIRN